MLALSSDERNIEINSYSKSIDPVAEKREGESERDRHDHSVFCFSFCARVCVVPMDESRLFLLFLIRAVSANRIHERFF